LPTFIGIFVLFALGAYFVDSREQSPPMYLVFLGLAVFAIVQGLAMKLLEKVGPTARRYVGEI